MKQTVVGIFDNMRDARKAVEHLLSNGFSHGVVDIHSATEKETSGKTSEGSTGIGNFFNNLFGNNKEEARTYTDVAQRGTVVTVHATTKQEAERAVSILDEYGAVDANERALQYRQQGNAGTDRSAMAGKEKSIPVIEEKMNVGKREVETGGVRVRSRVIERPVEEHLRLREEHVDVNRKPVDRPATDADFRNFEEGEAEITEHEEVPVVNKEARVVEEVKLTKETRERDQTVKDRVRETDVDVKKTQKDREVPRKDR